MAAFELVVVGAQKGGSTYLAALLGDHPDIYVCPDEVPYFEDPYFGKSKRKELERALAPAHEGQKRGIHRPDYLAHPEVPDRIMAEAPNAGIVAVLRDPVDRAISAYFWYVQFGLLPLVGIDEGMNRLLDGWTNPRYPHASEVLDYGDYG